MTFKLTVKEMEMELVPIQKHINEFLVMKKDPVYNPEDKFVNNWKWAYLIRTRCTLFTFLTYLETPKSDRWLAIKLKNDIDALLRQIEIYEIDIKKQMKKGKEIEVKEKIKEVHVKSRTKLMNKLNRKLKK
jgi:hypothetical protein